MPAAAAGQAPGSVLGARGARICARGSDRRRTGGPQLLLSTLREDAARKPLEPEEVAVAASATGGDTLSRARGGSPVPDPLCLICLCNVFIMLHGISFMCEHLVRHPSIVGCGARTAGASVGTWRAAPRPPSGALRRSALGAAGPVRV